MHCLHLLWYTGSKAYGLRSCDEMRGLVALQHVESSQIRDQTYVPFFVGWILIHWITREVPGQLYLNIQKNIEHSGMQDVALSNLHILLRIYLILFMLIFFKKIKHYSQS